MTSTPFALGEVAIGPRCGGGASSNPHRLQWAAAARKRYRTVTGFSGPFATGAGIVATVTFTAGGVLLLLGTVLLALVLFGLLGRWSLVLVLLGR